MREEPPEDGAKGAPSWRTVIPLLRRIITAQNIAAIGAVVGTLLAAAGGYTAWVKTGVTREVETATRIGHTVEFEIDVDKRLVAQKAITDQQFRELRDWQIQTDRDREANRNALQAELKELSARLTALRDSTNEALAVLGQRTSASELKLCVFVGRKISECR